MIPKRFVQNLLGLIWFMDGLFQLKSQMFTQAFIQQVILPVGQGQPHWIAALVKWGATIVSPHIVVWNAAFAAVQLLLGIAFMFNFKIRTTIVASVVWSLIVWVFGEGLGQLFTGQSLLLNGAPGAVMIYALVAIAIWPKRNSTPSEWNERGVRVAQLSLAAVFALGAVLHLQSIYLQPSGLTQAFSLPWLANAIGHEGTVVSLVLAAAEFVLAVMLGFRIRLRIAVWATLVVSFLFWWVGQSFGQVLDPLATDFNTGLLMMLLALCADPEQFQDFGHHGGTQHRMTS
ncbi:MAG: hypothetical protein K6T83_02475 [Alicyclobacillus sp.]|nr:hypothetical protein [Alicyclobacillus sp.]